MKKSRLKKEEFMKLLHIVELVLNCLNLAVELWDWIGQHEVIFRTFMAFLS